MRRIILCIISALCLGISLRAESPAQRDSLRHELRIGVGDQCFEMLTWQEPLYIIDNMPGTYERSYNENYSYSQHWFIEYQWRVNKWFSVGALADFSGCAWDKVSRNGLGEELQRQRGRNFWNIVAMPVCRFTWLGREHFSLYSAVGIGLGLNGGSELNAKGKSVECGLAFNISPIGITGDWGPWFCFAELGGLSSLSSRDSIYMLNSRIISLGVGIRF